MRFSFSIQLFITLSITTSGECGISRGYLCAECEGDCDSDADCESGLICTERSGNEAVPGCTGEGGDRDVYGKDVCTKMPEPENVTTFVGNPCTSFSDGGYCKECTGDCDRDEDCAGDLRCAQRSSFSGLEDVPGCSWAEGSDSIRFDNDDYCECLLCTLFTMYSH